MLHQCKSKQKKAASVFESFLKRNDAGFGKREEEVLRTERALQQHRMKRSRLLEV